MIDIIYPYVHEVETGGFAQWEELRYSFRSLQKNFKEKFRIWLVGDKPPWLSDEVNFISSPRGKTTNPPIDIVHKMLKVIKNSEISEDFIWMNDDIYFINPVKLKDITSLKAIGNLNNIHRSTNTVFRVNLWKTFDLLKKLHLPTWNYSTHLPFYFNKEKLLKIIKRFSMNKNSFLVTTLYHNYHFPQAHPTILNVREDKIKIGIYKSDPDFDQLRKYMEYKKFLNHSQTGFSEGIKEILIEMFPNKSKFEI